MSLIVGAVVAAIEGIALLAYAMYILEQVARLGITGPAAVSSPISVSLEIIIFGVLGLSLALAARGLWRGRRWARSMLLVGQFLALVVGVPLSGAAGGIERVVGFALIVLAVGGIAAAFWPSTTAAVADD